jgi:nitrite reductase/ring-hydroxylating ferredoxin subunit/DMSO/TMAO reductase YedYZ heme-binding membrane subunit
MSVSYTSILWNKEKKRYDKGIILFILVYLVSFYGLHFLLHPQATFETLFIRAFGILAFFLLHVILIIGPLCRLNTAFLPLLYNRRHLGVSMFLIGLIHGAFAVMQFHSLGDMNPFRSLFLSNIEYNSLLEFPFEVVGFFALIILGLMATSSHDFWLKNLGPKVWKSLHMLVYLAYAFLILHVILGALQNEKSIPFFFIVLTGFVGIVTLHLLAGYREKGMDEIKPIVDDGYARVCKPDEMEEDRAKMISCGERIAIFKYNNKLSAVHNICKHQGGPLGEGKIVDGCITCPWHGYQYMPENGQSPPPFNEKVATYDLKFQNGYIWVKMEANAEGEAVKPLDMNDYE